MQRHELEELADLVVQQLSGGRVSSTPSSVPPSHTAGSSVGRWEVPDVGWRMPMVGKPGARGTLPEVKGTPTTAPAARQSIGPSAQLQRMADYVDHTLLKAEARRVEIERLCDEAAEHRFAAVCVNGAWVSLCRKRLAGSGVNVATVVGFPLGATTTATKAAEARDLVDAGADELDMVAAVGQILDEEWDYVDDDIRAVVDAAKARTVKVILETATLEPLQIVKASAIAMEAGAHFVKTSTGFHPAGGATVDAVALMRLTVGDALGVKAAGGVRDCATAVRMIAAGANRIGTSSGVKFVDCMGAGPQALHDLLAAPERHESVCKTGGCGY